MVTFATLPAAETAERQLALTPPARGKVSTAPLLTVRHWNAKDHRFETFDYPIIGNRRNRFGEVFYYYIPVWREDMKDFMGYSANSSFIVSISETEVPLNPQQEAMRKVILYRRLEAENRQAYLRHVLPVHTMGKRAIGQNNVYGTRFTLQDEYEVIWEDESEGMRERAQLEMNFYKGLKEAEMQKAGIE